MSHVHPAAVVSRRADQRSSGAEPSSGIRYVATGRLTGGDFGLFEHELPPGGTGPGPHYHEGFSESFYVVEGALSVTSGDERLTVSAGELAYVPRYGVHGFENASDEEPVRFLILFTPGAPREDYFDAMAALWSGDRRPSVEEIDEVARRFDQINVRE